MATQTSTTKSKENSTAILVNRDEHHLRERLDGMVSERAFHLFEQNGFRHGDDLRHWLQAESEVLWRVPEIRESASWFTINVPIRGFQPNDLYVGVEPRRAVVAAETQSGGYVPFVQEQQHSAEQRAVFMVAQWPEDVDPSTASAYVKNDNLTLTVRRSAAAQQTNQY